MIFECLICGKRFHTLLGWYRHLLREHTEKEPGWAFIMRVEGRRVSLWKVYMDLKREGLVRARREGGSR